MDEKESCVIKPRIAVIGGGASGMMAAITAAEAGGEVTIYERGQSLGKKLLATGNGRCNLTNLVLNSEQYNGDRAFVEKALSRFHVKDTFSFFEGRGLLLKDREGYVYPYCEQASVVLDILKLELQRLRVRILYGAGVNHIGRGRKGYGVSVEGEKAIRTYDRVILACGGKASPKTGSDGTGYKLLAGLGIPCISVVPALAPLVCEEAFCKKMAGVRAQASLILLRKQKEIAREYGELQLTEYGISGIPVFQLAGRGARVLEQGGDLRVIIDFLPGIKREDLALLAEKREKSGLSRGEVTAEEYFTGLLHKKLLLVMLERAGIRPQASADGLKKEEKKRAYELMKEFSLHVIGTRGFDQAQVCAGGAAVAALTENMEVRACPGLYIAGELMDIDGRCGGYNLQWAWTSGYLAGRAAAGK